MSERRYSRVDGFLSSVDNALRTSLAASGRPDRGRLPAAPTRNALLDAHAAVTARAGIETALAYKRGEIQHDDTPDQRAVRNAMHESGTTGSPASLLVYAGALGVGHAARLAGDSASKRLRHDAQRRTRRVLTDAATRISESDSTLGDSLNRAAQDLDGPAHRAGLPQALKGVFDSFEKIGRVIARL